MSFTEHPNCFLWACDGDNCEKEVMFKPHDFMGCVAELRARGWSFHLSEDEGGRDWSHYCAYCNHKRKQTSIMNQRIREVR
jgi:hypothetical protein